MLHVFSKLSANPTAFIYVQKNQDFTFSTGAVDFQSLFFGRQTAFPAKSI